MRDAIFFLVVLEVEKDFEPICVFLFLNKVGRFKDFVERRLVNIVHESISSALLGQKVVVQFNNCKLRA